MVFLEKHLKMEIIFRFLISYQMVTVEMESDNLHFQEDFHILEIQLHITLLQAFLYLQQV